MLQTRLIRGGTWSAWLIALLAPIVLFAPGTGSAQTLARIQKAGAINIGFVPGQAPFSGADARGQPSGYAVELCNTVAGNLKTRLGLPNLAVNYVSADVRTGFVLLDQGRLDVLCGAVGETLRAREHVSFSIPIYITGIGAVVRKDASPALLRVLNGQAAHSGPTWRATVNAGLANHTFAVNRNTTSEAWVRERIAALGVIAKVVAVDTHAAGIEKVARKEADVYFADRVALTTYVAQRPKGEELVVLERRFTLEPVALALPRGDEDFRLVVDAALSKLYRSGDYVQTYARHFGRPTDTARMLFQANALF